MVFRKLAACAALALAAPLSMPAARADALKDFANNMFKHMAEVRAFRDKDGHVLMTGSRFLSWGDEAHLQALLVRVVDHKDGRLIVSFDDPRVQDPAATPPTVRFEADKTGAKLFCGPKTRAFEELPKDEVKTLVARAHYENEMPAIAPKPIVLGQLAGTQTFLFVTGTAGSSPNPILKVFLGPIRALETRASTTTHDAKSIVVKARDLTVTIGPGAQDSGVKVQWQGEEYKIEYLSTAPSNLESVLGPKLYHSVSSAGKKTPCDWLLD